jgi:hypothetical protein
VHVRVEAIGEVWGEKAYNFIKGNLAFRSLNDRQKTIIGTNTAQRMDAEIMTTWVVVEREARVSMASWRFVTRDY